MHVQRFINVARRHPLSVLPTSARAFGAFSFNNCPTPISRHRHTSTPGRQHATPRTNTQPPFATHLMTETIHRPFSATPRAFSTDTNPNREETEEAELRRYEHRKRLEAMEERNAKDLEELDRFVKREIRQVWYGIGFMVVGVGGFVAMGEYDARKDGEGMGMKRGREKREGEESVLVVDWAGWREWIEGVFEGESCRIRAVV